MIALFSFKAMIGWVFCIIFAIVCLIIIIGAICAAITIKSGEGVSTYDWGGWDGGDGADS